MRGARELSWMLAGAGLGIWYWTRRRLWHVCDDLRASEQEMARLIARRSSILEKALGSHTDDPGHSARTTDLEDVELRIAAVEKLVHRARSEYDVRLSPGRRRLLLLPNLRRP